MKSWLLTIAVFLNFQVGAQILHETKIIDFYGQAYYNQLTINSPDLLNLIDKYIDHGFYVHDVSPGKYSEFEAVSVIYLAGKNGGQVTVQEFLTDYQSASFNPLNYLYFPTNEFQVYKLSGVNKIIYILPQESILSR